VPIPLQKAKQTSKKEKYIMNIKVKLSWQPFAFCLKAKRRCVLNIFGLLLLVSASTESALARESVFATFTGDSTIQGKGIAGETVFTWQAPGGGLASMPGLEGTDKLAYNESSGPITIAFDAAEAIPDISRINFVGLSSPTSRFGLSLPASSFEVVFFDPDDSPLDTSHGRGFTDDTNDDLWIYDSSTSTWFFDSSLTYDSIATTILDFRNGLGGVGKIVITPISEDRNAFFLLKTFQ
jgi:hypothetical protein